MLVETMSCIGLQIRCKLPRNWEVNRGRFQYGGAIPGTHDLIRITGGEQNRAFEFLRHVGSGIEGGYLARSERPFVCFGVRQHFRVKVRVLEEIVLQR